MIRYPPGKESISHHSKGKSSTQKCLVRGYFSSLEGTFVPWCFLFLQIFWIAGPPSNTNKQDFGLQIISWKRDVPHFRLKTVAFFVAPWVSQKKRWVAIFILIKELEGIIELTSGGASCSEKPEHSPSTLPSLSSWWFQPIGKILGKLDDFPK